MKRIEWIDIAKGQTVFLVVLVHVLEGIYKTNLFMENKEYLEIIMSIIFLIVMPIFFALSGYVYKIPRNKEQFKNNIQVKILSFLWPYLLFSIIYVILQNFSNNDVHKKYQWIALLKIGWEPIGYLWFLETLFFIWLFMSFLFRLKIKIWWQMIIYLFMVILGWKIKGPLILQDICVWSIFFFMGYLIKNYSSKILHPVIVLISLVLVLLSWYLQSKQPNEWYNTNGPTPLLIIGKLASVIVAFKFFQILKLKRTKEYWLIVGRNSLIIYLVHAPLASILRIFLLKIGITNFYLLIIFVLFLTWYFSQLIVRATIKYKPLKIIFYPVSWWNERLKFKA